MVANDKLRSSRFNQTKKIASQTDLEWKTSDWVIQEIGLAIGRKMTPVLLIEVGCRKPGGLQGDVEYIPFERDAPERAFGRLLEMFEALSPRPSTGELASPDPATDISETTEAPPAPHDQVPDHTWDKEKFENAFIWNLVSSDPDRANEIDSAFRDSKLASTAEDTAAWTAVTELWRIRIGEQGSLSRLRENYLQFPRNWEIATTLASGLAALGMHSDSAQTYRDAAELVSSNVIEAERLLRLAAVQYAKGGDSGKTEELLRNQRINLTIRGKISELDYLFRYKEILADTGEDFLELEVLERIVQLELDDWNARFNLAYKYSTMQMNDMALYHYCQIPFSQRSAIAWNNLGVAFQQTSLSAKSIEAYKTSAEKGETLAMCNLAYKFMQAGFLKEADEELQRALQIKDFHRNIGEAVSSLKDIPENEDTKLKEAIKKIEPKRQFFNSLGAAATQADIKQLSEQWLGPNCELVVTIKDDDFVAVGGFERSANALSALLTPDQKPTRITIAYKGKIRGRRVVGTVMRKTEGASSTAGLLSLSSDGDAIEFAMVIDQSERIISVAERHSASVPSFYKLRVV